MLLMALVAAGLGVPRCWVGPGEQDWSLCGDAGQGIFTGLAACKKKSLFYAGKQLLLSVSTAGILLLQDSLGAPTQISYIPCQGPLLSSKVFLEDGEVKKFNSKISEA